MSTDDEPDGRSDFDIEHGIHDALDRYFYDVAKRAAAQGLYLRRIADFQGLQRAVLGSDIEAETTFWLTELDENEPSGEAVVFKTSEPGVEGLDAVRAFVVEREEGEQ